MRPPWVDAPFSFAPDWFPTAAPVSVPVTAILVSVPAASEIPVEPAPQLPQLPPIPPVSAPVAVAAPTTLTPVHAQGGSSMRLAFRIVAWEGIDRVDVGEGSG
ncbi:hypothetical protein FPQ18DRAFT_310328 [Pyronema domesticum]|nr:hypothetical protein FPQ18DRAFT_310328 [Pyronema domesticum]